MRIVFLAAGIVLLWQLVGALLVLFSACLLAIILHALARHFSHVSRLNYGLALAIVIVSMIVLLVGGTVVLGVQVQDDFIFLINEIPSTLRSEISRFTAEPISLDKIVGSNGWSGVLGGIANYTSAAMSSVTSIVLIVIGGIYLAAQPKLYQHMAVFLFPKRLSKKVLSVLHNLGSALEHWLLGQLVLMFGIGIATTGGLMFIGVPSALGLGILAGLLEFIPVIGPIAAAFPALVIALSAGYDVALWTLLLYLGIQQVEANLFVPFVQRRAVNLPPAVGLLSIAVFGVLFGPVGIMLSAPLAVCGQVLITQLYSRDKLGWPLKIPGTT